MDFALSSVRLTPSGVEMSGLGAPFCTARARRSLAMPGAQVSSRLRFGLRDRRVPYDVVKIVFFRRRTDLLKNRHFRPDERYLVAYPWRRIRLRIGKSHVQLQGIKVHALVALHEVHLIAVRITKMIEPGSIVITNGLNDECVSLPPANRVPVPTRIRIFRKWPPIGPDGAPQIVILHMLQHPVRGLNEFKWS